MTPIDALRAGELVLFSTDTIVGLHADASNLSAYELLWRRKGYDAPRPFVLLFESLEQLRAYASISSRVEEQLRLAWPGPVTVLLEPSVEAPAHWCEKMASLAARVPDLAPLRSIVKKLASPVFSSSANVLGQSPAENLSAARARFPDLQAAELALEGAAGVVSTLVDLRAPQARILRPGAAPWPPRGASGRPT